MNYIFLESVSIYFSFIPGFKQAILKYKMPMIDKFFLLSRKPKKALSGVFCRRSISEFNNSWNLDQRDFV